MFPVVLEQLENSRLKWSHSVVLTSEEGHANQMRRVAFPAEPVMMEVALLAKAESEARDCIRVIRCPLK